MGRATTSKFSKTHVITRPNRSQQDNNQVDEQPHFPADQPNRVEAQQVSHVYYTDDLC